MIQSQYVSATARDWTARSERSMHDDAILSRPSLGMLGVLSVEIIFGYELLAGVVLVVTPLISMFGWDRISDRTRAAVLVSIAAASVVRLRRCVEERTVPAPVTG